MLLTFGEAMAELLKKRGLSATAVAKELGFKSRTAFFRILHDESRIPAIEKCFEEAKKSALLALDENEIRQLTIAVWVSRLGKQTYSIHRVLHEMLYPAKYQQQEPQMEIVGLRGIETFEDVIALLPEGGHVEIILAGPCPKHTIDRLHRLTQERQVDSILHLFAIDEEEAEDVRIFSCISDILFSKIYSAYFLNETGRAEKNWWLRSGIILFCYHAQDGSERTVQLTRLNQHRYFCLSAENDSGAVFWKTLFKSYNEQLVPLKRKQDDESGDMSSYIRFTKLYQQLELNREIYSVRQDFPINCVPVEILAPPVIEAFAQICPEQVDSFNKQIANLYDIHKARVDNLYQKKKVTHIVLNKEAMMRFALTGNRSDHFFLTRPYTPQERVQVLTLLREQTMNNPNFRLWMGKNTDLISDKEITVYDGYGVALVKADTSWRLDQDHQEVLLESAMLAREFKTCFSNCVLDGEIMTKEESIACLDEMIEAARNAQSFHNEKKNCG